MSDDDGAMDPRLDLALRALAHFRAQMEAAREAARVAREAHEQQRAVVHEVLSEIGRAYAATGEGGLNPDEVADLYWHWPDVRVREIGLAAGLEANEVHRHAGRSRRETCHDCETARVIRPASRANPGGRTSWWRCGPCQEAFDAEVRRRSSEYDERMKAKRERTIVAIAAGGYWIDEDGSALWEGQDPTWGHLTDAGHECNGRLRLVGGETAWRDGGRVTYRCPTCGHDRLLTLVTYIPPSPTTQETHL